MNENLRPFILQFSTIENLGRRVVCDFSNQWLFGEVNESTIQHSVFVLYLAGNDLRKENLEKSKPDFTL
jgi:hypothetical protein